MRILISTALAAVLLLPATAVFAQVSPQERQLLLAFFQSTNGDKWTVRTGWTGPAGTECSWFGITCFNNSVHQLRLPYNNLGEFDFTHPNAETLPAQPPAFTQLAVLDLEGNRFKGLVPASWSNFPKLVSLRLDNNALDGPLPTFPAATATLEVIALFRNRFSGPLPVQWAQLTKLRSIDLYDNPLSGTLPSQWSSLVELRSLFLGNDTTTGSAVGNLEGPIPSSWGSLVRLESLSIGDHRLDGELPASLGQMVSLRRLYLGGNQLQGPLPASLGQLLQLRDLGLDRNQLSGALPAGLTSLTQLETLSLFRNALDGPLPANFSNLQLLQTALLMGNRFEGPVPESFGDMPALRELLLTGNRLSGPFPRQLTRLTGLERLGIGCNAFVGEVPGEILQMTGLVGLSPNTVDDGHPYLNGLWSDNPDVLAFIEARFPRFLERQTLSPTGLSAAALGNDSVRLSWTRRGLPSRYNITGGPTEQVFCDGFDAPCIDPVVINGPIQVQIMFTGVTSHDIGGLHPGVRYRFAVRATDPPLPCCLGLGYIQENTVTSPPGVAVDFSIP